MGQQMQGIALRQCSTEPFGRLDPRRVGGAAQAEMERAQSWQSVASRAIENQQQQQQQWQNAAFQWVQGQQQMNQQWFQHEREMFVQHQQSSREWANVAMVGVQQAQLGVKQWYDFAASTQQNVANILAETEQRRSSSRASLYRRQT